MSTHDAASGIDFFNDCIDGLARWLFYHDNDFQPGIDEYVSSKQVRKSVFVASILASSQDDELRRKALSFAILAYLKNKETDRKALYERYLFIILSRLGDLPAVNSFIEEDEREAFEEELVSSFDSVLSLELDTYRQKYGLGGYDYLSEFQDDILKALDRSDNVAISGPTSSGKSHIMQKYIEQKMEGDESFEAIYVVPTRALISEVSSDLSEKHEEITVKTGAYFDDEDKEENVFLVVTQERCLNLLKEATMDYIDPSLIFFDEFQKIEDDERGVLLEDMISSLREMWPDTQIVAAGPYLDNPGEKLENITEGDVEEVTTVFTPILQLKVILRFRRLGNTSSREIAGTIISPTGEEISFTIPEPEGMKYSDFRQSKKRFLKRAIDEFGEDDLNLIYSITTKWAEECANEISEDAEKIVPSDRTRNLIDFLSRTIHEKYSLISCLERGVAFHHRMVPKIARTEIEEIYSKERDIHTLISTSTLLEGVNLPAQNIFIHNPRKGREQLTEFDFSNLIGRVGRLNQRLYGTIYCIEREDKEWSEEKLKAEPNTQINPATDKAIQQNTDDFIEAVGEKNIYNVEEDHLRYTGILLRNKYLKEKGDEYKEYLKKKEMSDDEIDQIESQLDERLDDISIPEGILRRNPTIDPVQQNKLYNAVKRNPEKWVIGNHQEEYSYDRFLEVTRELNQIFLFINDREENISPVQAEIEDRDIKKVVTTANQWLRGYSYKRMIDKRQESDKVDEGEDDIDKSIRKMLEIVNDDIRFALVKYYRILTDILDETGATGSEWMLAFDQMLEMGSIDSRAFELMSMGVDRTVVIDLHIPEGVDDVVKYLMQRESHLPGFIVNHLKEQDVL